MTANQIRYADLLETQRHNVASEDYYNRSLSETGRHNVQTEAIGFANVGLGYANLSELMRHNLVGEDVNWHSAATARLNAETNELNAATRRDELGVSRFQSETARIDATTRQRAQQSQDTRNMWQNINDAVRSTTGIIDAIIPG